MKSINRNVMLLQQFFAARS